MSISSRYLSYLALILCAGFLAVATQAFAPITVAWLTFAIALGAAGLSMWLMFGPMTMIHRMLGAFTAVVSVWTIIASLVLAPTTVVWLGLAAAIGYACFAVGGLTVHELTTERVVHSLEVEPRVEAAA